LRARLAFAAAVQAVPEHPFVVLPGAAGQVLLLERWTLGPRPIVEVW
jgi:hypothetical protein